jgi:hypothetical protein
MATRKELYGKIFEKLGDFFRKQKSWANLPDKIKDAAKKDPKIAKKLKDFEERAKEVDDLVDDILDF